MSQKESVRNATVACQPEGQTTRTLIAPFISAIIPCRNEEKYIESCLDSIIANDYPTDRFEVLVVDGMSDDSSRHIAAGYAARYAFIKVLNNPKKTLAAAWNVGIKNGKGDIIIAMNAHAAIEPDFLSKCVRYLQEYSADCVGPVIVTHPQDETLLGKAIATAMSHPFGVGNSRFRTGTKEPCWVDTVHFSAYRKEVFERVGIYNEELVRSQDIEFHLRLKFAGGKILLVPGMTVHYYTRSNPRGFVAYGFINGYWVTYPFRFGAVVAQVRHLVPLVFVSSIIGATILSVWLPRFSFMLLLILALYSFVAFSVAVMTALKKKDIRFVAFLPLVFLTYHVTYGIGSMVGFIRALVSKRFWKSIRAMSAIWLTR
ncbi:MAG: glycosyltransferase family 2 protein [Candidatus Manganitrophus sp. SA1]|nr:glycosyltransferase family 2 protein [Candidatus Manganitrophus morganii]